MRVLTEAFRFTKGHPLLSRRERLPTVVTDSDARRYHSVRVKETTGAQEKSPLLAVTPVTHPILFHLEAVVFLPESHCSKLSF